MRSKTPMSDRFYHRLYKLAQECNAMFDKTGYYYVYFDDNKWKWNRRQVLKEPASLFRSIQSVERAVDIMNRDQWRLPI